MIKKIFTLQFLSFALIGGTGFLIDAGLFSVLHHKLDYALSRACSIFIAMTFTWLANRTLTFGVETKATYQEWMQYFSINSIGALINYSVFLLLVHCSSFLRLHFILPLIAATAVSMWFNFGLSRRVFLRIDDAK